MNLRVLSVTVTYYPLCCSKHKQAHSIIMTAQGRLAGSSRYHLTFKFLVCNWDLNQKTLDSQPSPLQTG